MCYFKNLYKIEIKIYHRGKRYKFPQNGTVYNPSQAEAWLMMLTETYGSYYTDYTSPYSHNVTLYSGNKPPYTLDQCPRTQWIFFPEKVFPLVSRLKASYVGASVIGHSI